MFLLSDCDIVTLQEPSENVVLQAVSGDVVYYASIVTELGRIAFGLRRQQLKSQREQDAYPSAAANNAGGIKTAKRPCSMSHPKAGGPNATRKISQRHRLTSPFPGLSSAALVTIVSKDAAQTHCQARQMP